MPQPARGPVIPHPWPLPLAHLVRRWRAEARWPPAGRASLVDDGIRESVRRQTRMAIDRWNPMGDMLTLRDAMNQLLQESVVWPGS